MLFWETSILINADFMWHFLSNSLKMRNADLILNRKQESTLLEVRWFSRV